MLASQYKLKAGDPAPDFRELPGADGGRYGLASFRDKAVLVVAFWCNHCPYVQAWERRVIEVQRDYGPRGVQVVAINANETENYPEDDFPHMVQRAEAQGYPFPYLRDESQRIADEYGAQCTPHLFVFDAQRRLRYQGRVDDSKDADHVKSHDLRNALDAILAGKEPAIPITPAMGCSIKWANL